MKVCPGQEYQRKLHPDDLPLRTHVQRVQKGEQCHFLVRKNPHYPRRKQILPPIIEKNPSFSARNLTHSGTAECEAMPCTLCRSFDTIANNMESERICKMCKNNFKSCEFCNKTVATKLSTRNACNNSATSPIEVYNPVYNIREIRTVCNSFSSLGIDKKLFDIQHNGSNSLQLSTGKRTNLAELVNNNPSRGYGNYVYV